MSQPDSALRCRVCGRGPARDMVIRRHVGMLVLQRFVKLRAPLCREHGVQLTKQYLGKTLIQGWWGYISFFVNWFVLVTDLVTLSQAKKLPEPAPLAAGAEGAVPVQPMQPGQPGQQAVSG